MKQLNDTKMWLLKSLLGTFITAQLSTCSPPLPDCFHQSPAHSHQSCPNIYRCQCYSSVLTSSLKSCLPVWILSCLHPSGLICFLFLISCATATLSCEYFIRPEFPLLYRSPLRSQDLTSAMWSQSVNAILSGGLVIINIFAIFFRSKCCYWVSFCTILLTLYSKLS